MSATLELVVIPVLLLIAILAMTTKTQFSAEAIAVGTLLGALLVSALLVFIRIEWRL
jgi:hypothetical protein